MTLIVLGSTRLAAAQANLDDLYSSSMASVSAVDDVKVNFLQMWSVPALMDTGSS